MEYFGVNVGHDPVYRPADIARAGFSAVRIVLQPHVDLLGYVDECHMNGVAVLGQTARESFKVWAEGGRVMSYEEGAEFYTERYGHLDAWGILNEADGDPNVNTDGSWCVSQDEANHVLRAFVPRIRALGSSARIYAVGTVTGQPDYVAGIDLAGINALDNHAYAQWPDTVAGMLGNYGRFGAPQVCTEFGWPHPDPATRGRYIRDMARAMEAYGLRAAFVYCWDLAQHPSPFGVVDHGKFTKAVPPIQELGYAPQQGGQPVPHFQLGFKDWHDRMPDLIGDPLEDEWGPTMNISQQRTSTGLLTWADIHGVGSVLSFYSLKDGARWLWDGQTDPKRMAA